MYHEAVRHVLAEPRITHGVYPVEWNLDTPEMRTFRLIGTPRNKGYLQDIMK